MRLDGKVAVVTGAARGIGRAVALAFARAGADLLLLDVAQDILGVPYRLATESQLLYTAEECRRLGVAVMHAATDVRDLASTTRIVDVAVSRFGRIDILVNNAGIAAPAGKIVHEIDEPEWELMIGIDLSGAWRMIKVVGSLLVAQRSGSIVNVSSTAGIVGYRHFAAYVAAKHGLVGLTRAVALDYAGYNVRANAVLPGSVTDRAAYEGVMLKEIARSLALESLPHEEVFKEAQPMNALIEPESVAAAVLWLGSEESAQVTGTTVVVDGAYTAR